MSTTVIIEGDESRVTRDRRFVCPFCDTVFVADSETYTLATYKEQADYGVTAFCTCPTCSKDAVSPVGSGGEIQTPVALVVQTLPSKTSYKPGEKFVTTGLVLGMKFTDGTIGTVDLADCTFDPSASDTLALTDTKVTVTHTATGLETEIPIAVARQVIPLVELASDDLVYTGSAQSVNVRNFNSAAITGTNYSKTNAGSYTATFTPKTGYCWPGGSTSAISIPWHIAKAVPVVTAPTPKTNLEFRGVTYSQPLIAAGTTSGGTMQYKEGGGVLWSSSVPTGTGAGTYTVYWKVVGDTNYEDAPGGSFKVTIAKGTPRPTATPNEFTLTDVATPGESLIDLDIYDGLQAEVTAQSGDEAVCTVALSKADADLLLTVTAVADGQTTVTVSLPATSNCNATTVTVTVKVLLD